MRESSEKCFSRQLNHADIVPSRTEEQLSAEDPQNDEYYKSGLSDMQARSKPSDRGIVAFKHSNEQIKLM